MFTEEIAFSVHGQRLAATMVYPSGRCPPSLLHLHGLGPTATRHGVRYLLDDLAAYGHASMTFEYSGNGDSTGVLTESSLRRRRDETLAAAGELRRDEAPVLLGTSMGAHLAASVVPQLRPRALILFCPATYPAYATDLKFDGSLAPPGNYPDSPAFAGLREFAGDLLIIAARADQVVPAEVVDGYLAAARAARSREVIRLDCDHFIHRWLPEREPPRARVRAAILRVLAADPVSQLIGGQHHAN